MARLRVTSTSTSAMIPRSAPSGSTESSGKRPVELAMGEALRPGRDTSHGSDSRSGARLPGEGPPAGLRRIDFPVAPDVACRGAGIGDHGGMPDEELLERVRELRARGRSPKEIARALKVRPATVMPLIRRLAAAEPQDKEAPLIGCWVNQGWSSSVRFTGHPEWPDTGAGETGESGLVIVVVARGRGSSVRVCEFLVDTWCLGVKNALGPKPVERRKLPSFRADAFRSYPGAPVEVPLVLA